MTEPQLLATPAVKMFYDCEFFEDGPEKPIRLISIGIVAEDGREYYAQDVDFQWSVVDPGSGTNSVPLREPHFLRTHVLPHMRECKSGFDQHAHANRYPSFCPTEGCPWRSRSNIRDDILAFVGSDKPEWWGYFADYDHVLLSQIFGRMIDLPKGWPMYTLDLKQWARDLGNPKLPKSESTEHNALSDARWNRDVWAFLQKAKQP